MGKVLIIRGANFAQVSVGKVETPSHSIINYVSATTTTGIVLSPIPFNPAGKVVAVYTINTPVVHGSPSDIFGRQDNTESGKNSFRFIADDNSLKFEAQLNTNTFVRGPLVSSTTMPITVEMSRKSCKVNGVTFYTSIQPTTTESVIIGALGMLTDSGARHITTDVKLHSYKQYSDANDIMSLEVDIVPVRRDNGDICLFDNISGDYLYTEDNSSLIGA